MKLLLENWRKYLNEAEEPQLKTYEIVNWLSDPKVAEAYKNIIIPRIEQGDPEFERLGSTEYQLKFAKALVKNNEMWEEPNINAESIIDEYTLEALEDNLKDEEHEREEAIDKFKDSLFGNIFFYIETWTKDSLNPAILYYDNDKFVGIGRVNLPGLVGSYIMPEYRGKGYGKKIIKAVLEKLKREKNKFLEDFKEKILNYLNEYLPAEISDEELPGLVEEAKQHIEEAFKENTNPHFAPHPDDPAGQKIIQKMKAGTLEEKASAGLEKGIKAVVSDKAESRSNPQLLTEFDRSDKEALMTDEGRFTISYEIELESRGGADGTLQGRQQYAANYLTFDYFSENAHENETGNFWHSYAEDEDPEADDLIRKYLIEEYPTRVDPKSENAENLIAISIAIEEDSDIAKEFTKFYNNITLEGTRENKALIDAINNDPDIKESLKKRGVQFKIAKQGSLPFGGEPEEVAVILGIQPEALKQIVHTHLFNPEDDEFFPGAGTDLNVDLEEFLKNSGWEEEAENWIEKGKEEVKEYVIDGGTSRYPVMADITYLSTGNWKSAHLKAMANMVESAAQTWVEEFAQDGWDEYQSDPEGYLNDMGYEWDQGYEPEDDDFMELMHEHFPRFMGEWADKLKFEKDGSLHNGIEFSMDNPKFMTGLNEAFRFLKDFFFDYNRQDNFHFDTNTGLHTNIGYLDEDKESHEEYNLMKALLFLNHDFAFKEFGQRKGTRWALDLKSDIVEKIEDLFKKPPADKMTPYASTRYQMDFRNTAMKLYKEDKLDDLGRELSRYISNYAPSNPKSLGFNIHYIDRLGYVEFRYPGGKGPTLEKMKNATLYYAYVIKQAVDPEFKKKEYEAKLVKLMTNLASHVGRPMNLKVIKSFMQKGGIYLFPNPYGVSASPLAHYWQYVLGHSLIYTLYGKDVGIFKGIRKGKTLKDTVAVFKTIAEYQAADAAAMEDKANYKIGEMTIPLPKLERMIVNGSVDDWGIPTPGAYTDMPSNSEKIANIFKAVEADRGARSKPPPKKRKLQEIRIKLLK